MSGACAASALGGIGAASCARPGTAARRVRPVVALRSPTRGLARRGSPTRVRPSLVPNASLGANDAGEDKPTKGFARFAASRGTRVVRRCAPSADSGTTGEPNDTGEEASRDWDVGKSNEAKSNEAPKDGDDVGAKDTEETRDASSDEASPSVDEPYEESEPTAEQEPPEEPPEEPIPEIKYKPPGVSKRKRATQAVPVVLNPVPPSERVPSAVSKADDASDKDVVGEGGAANKASDKTSEGTSAVED